MNVFKEWGKRREERKKEVTVKPGYKETLWGIERRSYYDQIWRMINIMFIIDR